MAQGNNQQRTFYLSAFDSNQEEMTDSVMKSCFCEKRERRVSLKITGDEAEMDHVITMIEERNKSRRFDDDCPPRESLDIVCRKVWRNCGSNGKLKDLLDKLDNIIDDFRESITADDQIDPKLPDFLRSDSEPSGKFHSLLTAATDSRDPKLPDVGCAPAEPWKKNRDHVVLEIDHDGLLHEIGEQPRTVSPSESQATEIDNSVKQTSEFEDGCGTIRVEDPTSAPENREILQEIEREIVRCFISNYSEPSSYMGIEKPEINGYYPSSDEEQQTDAPDLVAESAIDEVESVSDSDMEIVHERHILASPAEHGGIPTEPYYSTVDAGMKPIEFPSSVERECTKSKKNRLRLRSSNAGAHVDETLSSPAATELGTNSADVAICLSESISVEVSPSLEIHTEPKKLLSCSTGGGENPPESNSRLAPLRKNVVDVVSCIPDSAELSPCLKMKKPKRNIHSMHMSNPGTGARVKQLVTAYESLGAREYLRPVIRTTTKCVSIRGDGGGNVHDRDGDKFLTEREHVPFDSSKLRGSPLPTKRKLHERKRHSSNAGKNILRCSTNAAISDFIPACKTELRCGDSFLPARRKKSEEKRLTSVKIQATISESYSVERTDMELDTSGSALKFEDPKSSDSPRRLTTKKLKLKKSKSETNKSSETRISKHDSTGDYSQARSNSAHSGTNTPLESFGIGLEIQPLETVSLSRKGNKKLRKNGCGPGPGEIPEMRFTKAARSDRKFLQSDYGVTAVRSPAQGSLKRERRGTDGSRSSAMANDGEKDQGFDFGKKNLPLFTVPSKKKKNVRFFPPEEREAAKKVEETSSRNDNTATGDIQFSSFTQEEDDEIRKAVENYIEERDWDKTQGLEMLLSVGHHEETLGAWLDIAKCLPHYPVESIKSRTRCLLGTVNQQKWSDEEELVTNLKAL